MAYDMVNQLFDKGITDISLVEDKLNLSMMAQLRSGIEKAFTKKGLEFKKYIFLMMTLIRVPITF